MEGCGSGGEAGGSVEGGRDTQGCTDHADNWRANWECRSWGDLWQCKAAKLAGSRWSCEEVRVRRLMGWGSYTVGCMREAWGNGHGHVAVAGMESCINQGAQYTRRMMPCRC